jgi:hypothetical protein
MNEKQLQYVTFKQAKRLKELEFDWKCNAVFQKSELTKEWELTQHNWSENFNSEEFKGISAPTVALALKWIRDKKQIFSCVDFAIASFHKGYSWNYFSFNNKGICGKTEYLYNSFEAAESMLLNELLTLLEKKEILF